MEKCYHHNDVNATGFADSYSAGCRFGKA